MRVVITVVLGYHLWPALELMPKWRNWQTHGTQNPAVLCTLGVRFPPSAPIKSTIYRNPAFCTPPQRGMTLPVTLPISPWIRVLSLSLLITAYRCRASEFKLEISFR